MHFGISYVVVMLIFSFLADTWMCHKILLWKCGRPEGRKRQTKSPVLTVLFKTNKQTKLVSRHWGHMTAVEDSDGKSSLQIFNPLICCVRLRHFCCPIKPPIKRHCCGPRTCQSITQMVDRAVKLCCGVVTHLPEMPGLMLMHLVG